MSSYSTYPLSKYFHSFFHLILFSFPHIILSLMPSLLHMGGHPSHSKNSDTCHACSKRMQLWHWNDIDLIIAHNFTLPCWCVVRMVYCASISTDLHDLSILALTKKSLFLNSSIISTPCNLLPSQNLAKHDQPLPALRPKISIQTQGLTSS